jgi:hypothetical protein
MYLAEADATATSWRKVWPSSFGGRIPVAFCVAQTAEPSCRVRRALSMSSVPIIRRTHCCARRSVTGRVVSAKAAKANLIDSRSAARTTRSQSTISSSRSVIKTISAVPSIALAAPSVRPWIVVFLFCLYPCLTDAALLPNPPHSAVVCGGWEARVARQRPWDRDKDPFALRSPLRVWRTSWRSTKRQFPRFGLYTFLTEL